MVNYNLDTEKEKRRERKGSRRWWFILQQKVHSITNMWNVEVQWKGEKVYLFLKSYLWGRKEDEEEGLVKKWGASISRSILFILSSLCCRYFSCNQSHDHLLLHDTSLPAHLTRESQSPILSLLLAPFSIYFLVRKRTKSFPLSYSSLQDVCIYLLRCMI